MRSDEKSAFLNSSASVPPYCQIDSPAWTCLYRPMAPTRSASAAVGVETADGSTSPGFWGASNSVFTRSHPTAAITAAADARIVNRARFLFFIMLYRPRLGLVLQVESEGDVGRRRTRVEV